MGKIYSYFQPKYVSKFKCNGQACSAHCCKRWRIEIDKKTYKKYSHIKPKSAARDIIQNITRGGIDNDKYFVILDRNSRCPMLTEDNWCSIQKNYGEDFLSVVCVTYPRRTFNFGDFYERSLTLTCPVVAAEVLIPNTPIEFEWTEIPERIHSNLGRIKPQFPSVPQNLWEHIVDIQYIAVSILQERSLTIDQRLLILGVFLEELKNLTSDNKLDEIQNLKETYKSENFLKEQIESFSQEIKFNANEHMKIIFGTFESLYGGVSFFKAEDKKFIDAVVETLQVQVDENKQVSVSALARKYYEFNDFRKNFTQYFSTVFENYLVNEFFLNLYPWRFKGSIIYNYGVFLTIYKILELITMSLAISNFKKDKTKIPPLDKINMVAAVMMFVNNIDHNDSYVGKISDYLKGKENIVEIVQDLLQI